MKKKIYVLILVMVSALLLSACGVNIGGRETVSGRGSMVAHDLDVADFTRIEIHGAYELTFRQSAEFSVVLEIQENLFEYVNASVRGETFILRSDRNFYTTSGNTPHLIVYAPDLTNLDIRGASSSDIHVDTANLGISIEGAGSVTLVGSAETLTIDLEGAGSVNAFDMNAVDVAVSMAGAGSVEVYASSTLDVNIEGVGSVRYDGNPEVTQRISGFGSVGRR